MKLIRECRMGKPKTTKTGAVVGTYPKPLCYFGFDRDGISIIPPKSYTPTPGSIPFDCTYEDITFEKVGTAATMLSQPAKSKITVLDYTTEFPLEMTLDYTPQKAQEAAICFTRDFNAFNTHIRAKKEFPFKTVVFDSATGYADMMKMHLSSFNPNSMVDARQWAFMIGEKTRQLILASTAWPCHVVFIFHTSAPEKNEETSQVEELPSAYGKGFRDVIGGLFSQYFYATRSAGKPVIKNSDYMMVRGLGSRWPAGLPNECPADFKSIYGKELL